MLGVQLLATADISLEMSAPSMSLANSTAMNALAVLWEDKMERISCLPSYAEAKKRKSLARHSHG